MSSIDFNRIAFLLTLIVLAVLATSSGYRFEIGTNGIKFESDTSKASPLHRP